MRIPKKRHGNWGGPYIPQNPFGESSVLPEEEQGSGTRAPGVTTVLGFPSEDHQKKLRDQSQRFLERIQPLGTGDSENFEDDQDEISISTSDSESCACVQFIGPSPGVSVQPYQDKPH